MTARQRARGAGPTPGPAECAQLDRFLNPLASFVPGASQEFGTAAVVDGTLNGAVATTLWVLDADRRWRIDPTAYVYPTQADPDVHSAGTAPRPGNRFAANAAAWVAAWRARDCAAVFRLTDPFSAFLAPAEGTAGAGTPDGLCAVVGDSFAGDGFGAVLAANPVAVPQPLGAVDQYGFSLLRGGDGSLLTVVSVVRATNVSAAQRAAHDEDGVFDVYPAPVQASGRPHAPS